MPQRNILKINILRRFFVPTELISTCQHVLPSYCSAEDQTKGVTVLCVLKMNAKRHFLVDHRSLVLAKENDVRLPWTVTTACVHQKQTTALLVCYYFIILLVTFNTFKVHF